MRFETQSREAIDDGWAPDEDPPLLETDVSVERPQTILARNTSPDIGFDRSINPYRGCEHGCIYCFARPSHGYLGMSFGLDFETKLIARPDAPAVLERQLRARGYRPAPIALGTNTDPYQPIERDWRVMRGILEVLQRFRHPLTIATKGTMVERDIDILSEMGAAGLACVGISITTLDAALARRMEPRAPAPARRLRAIERLSRTGIDARVMVSPVVPGLTDPEIETILRSACDAGAVAASWVMLRLPFEVSGLFEGWLERHAPDRKAKVLARIREMHRGALYASDWGHRMRGEGVFAELIAKRFDLARARLHLVDALPPLRADQFRIPLGTRDQPALF